MANSAVYYFICFHLITFYFNTVATDELPGFGEYDVYLKQLNVCKGLKKLNYGVSYIGVSYKNSTKGLVLGNFTVTKETGPVMQKIRFERWNGSKYTKVFDVNSDNVCKNKMMMKYVYTSFVTFRYTDSRCIPKKGTVILTGLDVQHYPEVMFGNRFIYGKYRIYIHFLTSVANYLSLECEVNVVKKNSKVY